MRDLFYRNFIRPLFFLLDAERAHNLALSGLQTACSLGGEKLVRAWFGFEHPSLEVKAFNLTFPNPIGLAAGFDKDARHLDALASLGFGFLEAGTVTLHPQRGNPKPRIKRLPDVHGLWNHLGFNNDGAQAVEKRLSQIRLQIPLGVNIGKSKIVPIENAEKDYLASFKFLSLLADYIVLNVSSPNTPGLRTLQDKERISGILREIEEANAARKPVLIKVSPDLDFEALDTLLEVGFQYRVAGFIATNTTLSPDGIGGISGGPLKARSTEVIRHIYQRVGKNAIVIGSGGIFSAEDAYEKILAGATLVQIYTGLVYEGPGLVRQILKGLVELLDRDGFPSISDAIGMGVRRISQAGTPKIELS